jgi:hypothetical protein
MKYALLIYTDPAASNGLSAEEQDSITAEYMVVGQDPGIRGGEQLQPIDAATTVRVDGAQTLTTDGPFADTKEILGGFYLFEADDLDAAIALAARIPAARTGGSVEIRPIVERQS